MKRDEALVRIKLPFNSCFKKLMFEVKKSPFHLLETKFPQTALLGRGCPVLSLEDDVVG